ncbi:MAG: hypothetical protein RL177_1579 [Bacteroidota bacterium]|jgi:signal transduction histidine kinase
MLTFLRNSALLLIAYVVTAWFGISHSSVPPYHLSILWMPAGIAILGLVLLGWRALPVIFIATSIVNWPTMLDMGTLPGFVETLTHAFISSSLDTLQPAIGAWMYGRVCKQGCLLNEKTFVLFTLAVALLPSILTGWAIILNYHWAGFVTYDVSPTILQAIINLTITDALGIFMVVPVYDALVGLRGQTIRRREYIEFVLLIIVLFAFLYLVNNNQTLRPILVLIPLTGLALRNGVVGSAVGFLITFSVLVMSTVKGVGPFTVSTFEDEFLSLMSFMFALGMPVHFIAISIRNVKRLASTLEHRVEERTMELKEKEARLIELNKDKDRLMSIIGHDLRNPIQGIMGISQLITEDARNKDFDDIEMYGAMVMSSAQQTQQLLHNLLDWSASQSGRIHFTPHPQDISRLVSEALHVVDDMAKSKSITLKVDVEMGLTANVDKQMMATILRNLVSNSLKFTPTGGTVLTTAHSTEHGFRLTVTDTGVGMTETQVRDLLGFSSVASSYGTNGEKGSGLGLLLVHEFALKHGATIRVDSELGKGTTFQIDFPNQF